MHRTVITIRRVLKLVQRAGQARQSVFVALLLVGSVPLPTLAQPVQDGATIKVHAPESKRLLAEISRAKSFNIVARDDRWQTVRFTEPTVPVWVSSDFLFRENGRATVIANRLNMRTGPSMQSEILASVERGYQSPILREQAGFSEIHAPTWVTFVVSSDTQTAVAATAQGSEMADTQTESKTADWRTQVPPGQLSGGGEESVDSPSGNEDLAQAQTSSAGQDNNSEATEKAANASVEAQQHRLAPGDIISLRVFGESELSVSNLRIPQSGDVSFPLIGPYQVAGKTTNEVEKQTALFYQDKDQHEINKAKLVEAWEVFEQSKINFEEEKLTLQ